MDLFDVFKVFSALANASLKTWSLRWPVKNAMCLAGFYLHFFSLALADLSICSFALMQKNQPTLRELMSTFKNKYKYANKKSRLVEKLAKNELLR